MGTSEMSLAKISLAGASRIRFALFWDKNSLSQQSNLMSYCLVFFTQQLSMDLPPDKAKLLKNYDNEKKWDIICDQVSAPQTPQHLRLD
jgi:hypothetical protein